MRIHIDQPELFENKFRTLLDAFIESNDIKKNQKILNSILDDDEHIIFIDGEVERLSPLTPRQDWFISNLLTLDFKGANVYYVNSDYNIKNNVDSLIKILKKEIKTKLNLLIHPYLFNFNENSKYNETHFHIDNHTLTVNQNTKTYKLKYNIISLNCTKKTHRTELIKELKNEQNFIYSYYPYEDEEQLNNTFNDKNDRELLNELTELNEIYDHDLFMSINDKNIKEKTKDEIRESFESKHFSFQECVPLEYIQSCMDLVTESYVDDCIMLTEKTFKPIALKKPFLLLSAKNSHKFLQKEGYELYDELFDYSFDSKPYKERFNSIIEQAKEILKIPTKDFSKLCKSVSEKINYNADHRDKSSFYWTNLYHDLDDEEYVNALIKLQQKFL